MDHAIIWDLETVPDFASLAEHRGIPISEVRSNAKKEFPPIIFHRIVCIGALVCSRAKSGWQIQSLGAPSIDERSEAELVRSFVERIDQLSPKLITFNGSSFDLPVLRYRAMSNQISAPKLNTKGYFNRYSEDALDLCDVLASFDTRARTSLDLVSRTFGLAGKSAIGIHGSDVEKYVSTGRVNEVANYCEGDVVNTFRIWLRYELFRGTLSNDEFVETENNLFQFIRTRSETKPHLLPLIG